MEVMAVVGAYILVTAPLLALIILVHGLKSDYTGVLMAGLVLQIIPIGLLFYPLGFIGVLVLAYTLVGTVRRNRRFKTMGIDNPEVYRRWSTEYLANLVAFSFAIEQKGIGLLFIDVASHKGFGMLWALVPLSVLLWIAVIALIVRERKGLPALQPDGL